MSRFGKELIQSMREAREHAEGKHKRFNVAELVRQRRPIPNFKPSQLRVHVVAVPNVRAIRRQLGMSQTEFAQKYKIPLATLKNWEQGRRQPDAPASAYLQAIAMRPDVIRDALKLKERLRRYQPPPSTEKTPPGPPAWHR